MKKRTPMPQPGRGDYQSAIKKCVMGKLTTYDGHDDPMTVEKVDCKHFPIITIVLEDDSHKLADVYNTQIILRPPDWSIDGWFFILEGSFNIVEDDGEQLRPWETCIVFTTQTIFLKKDMKIYDTQKLD